MAAAQRPQDQQSDLEPAWCPGRNEHGQVYLAAAARLPGRLSQHRAPVLRSFIRREVGPLGKHQVGVPTSHMTRE